MTNIEEQNKEICYRVQSPDLNTSTITEDKSTQTKNTHGQRTKKGKLKWLISESKDAKETYSHRTRELNLRHKICHDNFQLCQFFQKTMWFLAKFV